MNGLCPKVQLNRRSLLAGSAAVAGMGLLPLTASAQILSARRVRIRDDASAFPISPLIYGSSEIGAMDGGPLSASLDRAAGVTARRLGGNLMTGYNWRTNATNAGADYKHSNGAFLLEALRIPRSDWSRPAVVIEAMHEASLGMGAQSLVALPIGGYVAADFDGSVDERDHAPSRRFAALNWGHNVPGEPGVVDMRQLLKHLVRKYGGAASNQGISAYTLDNEPGLWTKNHPRLFPDKTTIASFLERSVAAARIIKSIDPAAKVFGPGSWGATEMVSFQDAPDWSGYKRYGNFLAAYLDAFRKASEQEGVRLLDALDVHWYPFSAKGDLFRTDKQELEQPRLDAPRSLLEKGFVEDSWVPRALKASNGSLSLPILPALKDLIARMFPGTDLAITEFNYGGAGSIVSGLALADALGSLGLGKVSFASHWGSLAQWLGQAYQLYRMSDAEGLAFGSESLSVENPGGPEIVTYAALNDASVQVIAINRSQKELPLELGFATGEMRRHASTLGFDVAHPQTQNVQDVLTVSEGAWRLLLPPRSARRYKFV